MRGLRSLIVLLVIALPLGWFAYRDSTKPADSGRAKRDKVFTVEADKIEEISLKSESGERTRLQKSGNEWKIVAPAGAPPDANEISGVASGIASLEMERVVDENPPDLKEYGLAQPRIEVAFKADGKEQTLLIGQKTPPATDLYAKRAGETEGLPHPGHLESTFNKTTFDLRDKAVLKIDRDKLDALEFTAGDKTSRFAKPAGEWQIAAPVQARADFSAIEGIVSRLTGLQMKSDRRRARRGRQEVRARQAGGDGQVRHRLVAGDARRRRAGRRRHGLRTGSVAAGDLHHRIERPRRAEEGSRPSTGRRISSTPAASTRRGSRSSAPARPTRSRRPRSRTRKARTKRSGGS